MLDVYLQVEDTAGCWTPTTSHSVYAPTLPFDHFSKTAQALVDLDNWLADLALLTPPEVTCSTGAPSARSTSNNLSSIAYIGLHLEEDMVVSEEHGCRAALQKLAIKT